MLEGEPPLKRIFEQLAVAFLAAGLSLLASAQELNEFRNGQVADANALNENFQRLKQGADFYDDASYYEYHLKNIPVDCSEDASALDAAWNDTLHLARVRYTLKGVCEAPSPIFNAKGDSVLSGTLPVVNGGRVVQLTGSCTAPSPSARLVLDQYGLVANNGGTLLVTCLELSNSPSIRVYANSYLRVQSVITGTDDRLSLYSFDGGVLRLFGRGEEVPSVIRNIQLTNGGVLRLGGAGNWNIDRIATWDSTVAVSSNTTGKVNDYFSVSSSGEIDTADFVIENLLLNFGSTLRARCIVDEDNLCASTGVMSVQSYQDSHFYEYIE